jgi:hypothetical protein
MVGVRCGITSGRHGYTQIEAWVVLLRNVGLVRLL